MTSESRLFRFVPLAEVVMTEHKYQFLPEGSCAAVDKGTLVKLWCEAAGPGRLSEVFWVLVTRRLAPGARGLAFEGRVNNRLRRTAQHGLSYEDVVRFTEDQIVDIALGVKVAT
jgi:hypothetical protein